MTRFTVYVDLQIDVPLFLEYQKTPCRRMKERTSHWRCSYRSLRCSKEVLNSQGASECELRFPLAFAGDTPERFAHLPLLPPYSRLLTLATHQRFTSPTSHCSRFSCACFSILHAVCACRHAGRRVRRELARRAPRRHPGVFAWHEGQVQYRGSRPAGAAADRDEAQSRTDSARRRVRSWQGNHSPAPLSQTVSCDALVVKYLHAQLASFLPGLLPTWNNRSLLLPPPRGAGVAAGTLTFWRRRGPSGWRSSTATPASSALPR